MPFAMYVTAAGESKWGEPYRITAGNVGDPAVLPGGSTTAMWTWDLGTKANDAEAFWAYHVASYPDWPEFSSPVPGEVVYVVPEPGTFVLLLCGVLGLLIWRRRAA
jgi:hypothetical protein